MLVMGLDVATVTGVCWLDRSRAPSDWRVFAVESEGDFQEEKYTDLGRFISGEIGRRRPDFAVIEMPQRSVTRFSKKSDGDAQSNEMTINPNSLQLTGLASAAATALELGGVPWGVIAPATWRSAYYGRGYKPHDGDWKAAAIVMAERQGIVLPQTKKGKADSAEAVGIASAWQSCKLIPRRHHGAFIALRMGRVAA